MNTLDERINKIRQQNEEIRRRYEEVEEDKKKAAKSNALVQMIPSSDWPQRKEPPEFSNPPRNEPKPKPATREHTEHSQHSGAGDGKKVHVFAHGEGPPPDPKYNFLADSEREEYVADSPRESGTGRGRGRPTRGNFKKRGIGREGLHKDNRMHHASHKDGYQPEYDAWKAERNRIDEDRISRQRTAEGNWRREWDNDKAHVIDEGSKREARPSLGNFVKREHKDYDKRYFDGNEHVNHRGTNYRSHQGGKSYHGNHDFRYNNLHDQHGQVTSPKSPTSSGTDERTVIATDKSIKVTLNQGSASKGPVMSVKVNSPSIAGTGRVGPRQRTRVTYSSHSDAETATHSNTSFSRQKSFEDKFQGMNPNSAQKPVGMRRPHQNPQIQTSQVQRRKEGNVKSPYAQRKDFKREDNAQKQYHSQKPKVFKTNDKSERKDNSDITQLLDQTNEKVSSECSAPVEHEQKENITENTSIIEKSDGDKCSAAPNKNETVIESIGHIVETIEETSQAVSAVPVNTVTDEFIYRNDENVENIDQNIDQNINENIDNVTQNADSLNKDLNQLSATQEKTVIESTAANAKSIEDVNESVLNLSVNTESDESVKESVKEIDKVETAKSIEEINKSVSDHSINVENNENNDVTEYVSKIDNEKVAVNNSANKSINKSPVEDISFVNEVIACNTLSDEIEKNKTENSSERTENLIEETINNDRSDGKEIAESSKSDNCDKLKKEAVDDNQDKIINDLKKDEKVSSDFIDDSNSSAIKKCSVIDVDVGKINPDNVPTQNILYTEDETNNTGCKKETNTEKSNSENQQPITNNDDNHNKSDQIEHTSVASNVESTENLQIKDTENLPCKDKEDKVIKNEENTKLARDSNT